MATVLRVAPIAGFLGLLVPTVASANQPPPAPTLVSPAEGAIVDDPRPTLSLQNVVDGDGDALTYQWQLATSSAFTVLEDSGARQGGGGGVTSFDLAPALTLAEDSSHCWRARADDGHEAGLYSAACFIVSTRNDPPTVPAPHNPSDEMAATTTTPVFSWAPSTDPEGGSISYEIVVRDVLDRTVGSVTGVNGTVTSIATELINGERYTWAVRATDRMGASSDFSPERRFAVNAPSEDDIGCGDICDNSAFLAHTSCVCEDAGCCQTGSSPGAGTTLAALGLVGLATRRRGAAWSTSSRTSPR